MSGDTSNAHVWQDADVYVAPLGTALPTDGDTAFGVGWELVGLLDGDAGFTQSRAEDKADMYAWGGVLVRSTRRNFKLTYTFTALEDNAVTRDLIWPGSTTGSIVVPRPEQLLVAFEKVDGDLTHRLITANYAEVEINGDVTDNEADLTRFPFLVTIFPDTSTSPATLLTEQESTPTP
jgi:hypothetical protein